MSPLTIENHLLFKAISSVICSRGGHIEHHFSAFRKAGLARTLFISQICFKVFAVNIVFEKFNCQLQKKEYLIVVFRHWPLSCKQFLLEHFAGNRMLCNVRSQDCGA